MIRRIIATEGSGEVFFRLLDVVLPLSGYAIMWEVYFDESYTKENTPIMCVAGYILEKRQAKRLDRAWRQELARNNLPYFHMVDCAHGNPPFDKLERDERIKVQTRMIEIIKQRTEVGLAITINEQDFGEEMKYRFLGTPYAFCAHAMTAGVRGWIENNPDVDQMAYFYEAGHPDQSEFDYLVNSFISRSDMRQAHRYEGHAFVIKEKTPVAQAADLLAWQWYTDRRHKIEGRPRRKDCASLLEHPHQAIHLDKGAIAQTIKKLEELPAIRAFTDEMKTMPAKALNKELWRITLGAASRQG